MTMRLSQRTCAPVSDLGSGLVTFLPFRHGWDGKMSWALGQKPVPSLPSSGA
jgi:hypothetical protein